VGLIGGKSKGDAVASMNPKLTRQKGQSLVSLVSTLCTHVGIPDCGLNRRSSDQNRQHQCATEDGQKPDGSQKAPHSHLPIENSFRLKSVSRIVYCLMEVALAIVSFTLPAMEKELGT